MSIYAQIEDLLSRGTPVYCFVPGLYGLLTAASADQVTTSSRSGERVGGFSVEVELQLRHDLEGRESYVVVPL